MRELWHKAIAAQFCSLFMIGAATADCTYLDNQIREAERLVRQTETLLASERAGLTDQLPDAIKGEEEAARSEMVRLGCNRAARRNDPECVRVYSRINEAAARRKAAIGRLREETRPAREALQHRLRTLLAERQSCRGAERAARRAAARGQPYPPPPPADDLAAAHVIGTFIGIGMGAAAARSARPRAMAPSGPQFGPRVRCHPGPDGRMHCGGN